MNLRRAPETVLTPRLELRVSDPAFAPQFADALAASRDDLFFVPGWLRAVDVEVATASLRRSVELADVDVVRHAFERDTGRYVARLDLHSWDDEAPRCELGYVADSRLTGRGLVTEAALAMLDIAWELGAQRVQAMCDPRNEPSIRLAERVGMQHEGVLRWWERDASGELVDQVVLAALRPVDTLRP
jgi:RimJ/RimL family protein N-acetyltransferase